MIGGEITQIIMMQSNTWWWQYYDVSSPADTVKILELIKGLMELNKGRSWDKACNILDIWAELLSPDGQH